MAFSNEVCDRFLWRLASLSPLARRRLETEDYRHHLLVDEDGPEEQLFDIFQSLLHDLESIGITYAEPINQIFENDGTVEMFLELMDYIMPASLYLYLRDDKTLQHGLYCLTDGSVTDKDLLGDYLDYLYAYEPSLQKSIRYYKDKLVGTYLFTDYLKGLLTHLGDQHIQSYIPHERIALIDGFITKLKTGIVKLSQGNILGSVSGYNDVVRIIENQCSDPEYAQKLATWLEMRLNRTPKAYISFYECLTKSILVSLPLDKDYFSSRNMKDFRSEKDIVIGCSLLGYATGKYGPKRWKQLYPNQSDFIDRVYGILTHG